MIWGKTGVCRTSYNLHSRKKKRLVTTNSFSDTYFSILDGKLKIDIYLQSSALFDTTYRLRTVLFRIVERANKYSGFQLSIETDFNTQLQLCIATRCDW